MGEQAQRKDPPILTMENGSHPPSLRTDAYSILTEGFFPPHRLKLHVQGGRRTYPSGLATRIQERWEQALQEAERSGCLLFNGKLFSLLQYAVRGRSLNLLLGETDYREVLGTHSGRPGKEEGPAPESLADGIALSSSLLTKDGFLIVGRRSARVYAGREKLHVCAGHPDPDRQLSVEEILSGENLFYRAMQNEIEEEIHVPPDRIEAMICRGLIRSRDNLKPELIFETALKRSKEQVLRDADKAKERMEHDELLFVPSEEKELREFFVSRQREFTAPGLAAMAFFGAARKYWRMT
jgi:hypothetical protein